jgi:hypothetical protein
MDRKAAVRLIVILSVGAVAVGAVARYRRSLRPKAAPDAVQRAGREHVDAILARIEASPFGQSERGRLLTATIRDFAERGRLVFTADIPYQALYRRELGGYAALYVKVLRVSRALEHQSLELTAEGIYHEAVHARSPYGKTTIEEECDGYVAGLTAGAIAAGRPVPARLTLDGMSVGQFVLGMYKGLPRRSDYQPMGESPEWLRERAGLD